jgi:serine/threonine protein kinase
LEDYKDTIKEYLIGMEYCSGGSISKCLKKYYVMYGKPFSEEIVQYLMRQIIQGVKFIHEKGIIHRDLKNENIYVKFYDNREDYNKLNMMKTHIKIGDFGFAIRENNANKIHPAYKDQILLKKYNERLIFKDIDTFDKSSDIWSLGALCYEMLTCQKIFIYKNISELYNSIGTCSNELTSFLNGMLVYDPKKRLTIDQLSQHDFLKKDIKQFNKISIKKFINNIREERTNIDENSRFSTNISKSMLSSGSMFSGWSKIDEGSKKLDLKINNKPKQMQKLIHPQNINININPNIQIQNTNLNQQNIPKNQNVINNNSNKQKSNLAKSMFIFQPKNSIDKSDISSSTIINNSSYGEFNSSQDNFKFQNIKNNFNQSQNSYQNTPSTSFNTNINPNLSFNNNYNYQANPYSQISNYPSNNVNNYKHSISGQINHNPQKPTFKNYKESRSGPIRYNP